LDTFNPSDKAKSYVVSINDTQFETILVNDEKSRIQGLSGRDSLSDNTVMLFVFDRPGKYGIWMKDMNFPIDIIWLDEKGKVVTVESNVSPDTFPKTFYPASDSLYTIEAKSGFIDKNRLGVGATVSIIER
jgi:hypothetical protein